jgi:hypothetical protein
MESMPGRCMVSSLVGVSKIKIKIKINSAEPLANRGKASSISLSGDQRFWIVGYSWGWARTTRTGATPD